MKRKQKKNMVTKENAFNRLISRANPRWGRRTRTQIENHRNGSTKRKESIRNTAPTAGRVSQNSGKRRKE